MKKKFIKIAFANANVGYIISSVKITTKASNIKDMYINKPPLPIDVFEDVNTPISCINTLI